uniref:Uncharacterized protein n=1 Tax=Timema douglasi TaxID=61478 RepID=A0A7R8ZC74_TIMDO|nr:unnamed protein product [Timema douglasi]
MVGFIDIEIIRKLSSREVVLNLTRIGTLHDLCGYWCLAQDEAGQLSERVPGVELSWKFHGVQVLLRSKGLPGFLELVAAIPGALSLGTIGMSHPKHPDHFTYIQWWIKGVADLARALGATGQPLYLSSALAPAAPTTLPTGWTAPKRRLQMHQTQLEEWQTTWRTSINVEKSTAMLFTWKRKFYRPAPPRLFGEQIRWADSVKYLGLTLDIQTDLETTLQRETQQGSLWAHLSISGMRLCIATWICLPSRTTSGDWRSPSTPDFPVPPILLSRGLGATSSILVGAIDVPKHCSDKRYVTTVSFAKRDNPSLFANHTVWPICRYVLELALTLPFREHQSMPFDYDYENSPSYWLVWWPLTITFSRTNGKFPFLSLDKVRQQRRIRFSGDPPWRTTDTKEQIKCRTLKSDLVWTPSLFTVPTSHRDSCCRDSFLLPTAIHVAGTLSYLPPRLMLPGLLPTSHRDSRCRDSFLPPTATHVAKTLSYLPPRLTLPGLYPTSHCDSRCRDSILPPTATHVAGTPSYRPP